DCRPVFDLTGRCDGAAAKDGSIWGTYIHGVFDNHCYRRYFLNSVRRRKGLPPLPPAAGDPDAAFNILADTVRKNIDIRAIYSIISRSAAV
ncbi:MAG: cobyric acid synthase, partial [Endomicrobiales bacterium]